MSLKRLLLKGSGPIVTWDKVTHTPTEALELGGRMMMCPCFFISIMQVFLLGLITSFAMLAAQPQLRSRWAPAGCPRAVPFSMSVWLSYIRRISTPSPSTITASRHSVSINLTSPPPPYCLNPCFLHLRLQTLLLYHPLLPPGPPADAHTTSSSCLPLPKLSFP